MKNQFDKLKNFARKHESEILRLTYYVLGAAAGITAVKLANRVSFDRFALKHPEHDYVLRDKNGNFYGINERE